MDLTFPANQRVKIKENEKKKKKDKKLDIARELRQLWNTGVTVQLIVTDVL